MRAPPFLTSIALVLLLLAAADIDYDAVVHPAEAALELPIAALWQGTQPVELLCVLHCCW